MARSHSSTLVARFVVAVLVIAGASSLSLWVGNAIAYSYCPRQELWLVSTLGQGEHTGAVDPNAASLRAWTDPGHLVVTGPDNVALYVHLHGDFRAHRVYEEASP
jgi:hypothetical protein